MANLDDLDLPDLAELLDDPFWEELGSEQHAACSPGCGCQQTQPQASRQGCRRGTRRRIGLASQQLTLWPAAEASLTSSDTADPIQRPGAPAAQQAAARPSEYPSSSQDSSHRPASPAETLRDTSCTPASVLDVPVGSSSLPSYSPCTPPAWQWFPAGSQPVPGLQQPQQQQQQQQQQQPVFQFGQAGQGKQQQQQESSTGGSEADPEEAKRMARMQRNRESAHHSRQRKKMQANDLERRCHELQLRNTHLTGI